MPNPERPDDVEHVEGHRAAVDLGQGLQVAREGLANGRSLLVVEPADPGGVGEASPVVLDHGHRLQHPEPRRQLGAVQRVEHGTLGGAEGERPTGVVRHAPVVLDLRGVGPHVAGDEVVDRAVGQRLLPAQQGQAGDEAGQVPRPVPEVGLVEVVDVEDEPTVGVEVGAEVLGVQVTLDPDARPVVVHPVLVEPGVCPTLADVRVEQARGAAVERERVTGHLAELRAEAVLIAQHQRLEGLHQRRHDQARPLVVRVSLSHGPRSHTGGQIRSSRPIVPSGSKTS